VGALLYLSSAVLYPHESRGGSSGGEYDNFGTIVFAVSTWIVVVVVVVVVVVKTTSADVRGHPILDNCCMVTTSLPPPS